MLCQARGGTLAIFMQVHWINYEYEEVLKCKWLFVFMVHRKCSKVGGNQRRRKDFLIGGGTV